MVKSNLEWEIKGLLKFLEAVYAEKNLNKYKKIMFVAITRKGYNLYKMFCKWRKENNRESVLDRFDLISDRYLSKIITFSDYQSLILGGYDRGEVLVILFDDNFNRGNNIFKYYVLMRCWGAEVLPVVYTCTLISEGRLKMTAGNDEKWREFREIYSHVRAEEAEDMSEEELRTEYERYIDEFNNGRNKLEFAKYVTSDDKYIFNQKILNCLEQENYPMAIDLPMVGATSGREYHPMEIIITEWDGLLAKLAEHEWEIVRNVVEEPRQLKVTASFLEVPAYITKIMPSDTVFNSIVKCKYHADGERMRFVFVPFVIMRSLDYEVLVDYFIDLYQDTEYYFNIEKSLSEEVAAVDLRQVLIESLGCNLNLYVALYRAVVWYFSGYIAAEFVECIRSILPGEEIGYDEDFMKEHMPLKLLRTIKEQLSSVKEMRRRIEYLSGQNEDATVQFCEGMEAANWDNILYFGKAGLAERKYQKDDRMLSIEEFEEALTERFCFRNEKERRRLITRAITAFLEESFWGNELENDRGSGRVRRGFALGECSAFLYGSPLEVVYPYIYAFYMKEEDAFEKKYPYFIEILRAFLGKEGVLGSDIPECAFNFYTDFFKCEGDILKEKMVNSKYILHDFLRGQDDRYQREFDWVQNLEL